MFRVESHSDLHAVVLMLFSDVDMATADDLRRHGMKAIAQADGRPVVVDAACVEFIDSTGLGALVELNNTATAAGKPLVLRAVPARMASVLRIAGLDLVRKIHDSNSPTAEAGDAAQSP